MFFSDRFISASPIKNQYEKHANAPIFRRIFNVPKKAKSHMQICGLGFYRVFINGKELTKGRLAPYISNTEEVVYYDTYDIQNYIVNGKNTLTILLGNGLQNGIGGEIFGFDKASWVSPPKVSVAMFVGDKLFLETDDKFECCNSPITFDDLWAGEHYDARLENLNAWRPVIFVEPPKGEKRQSSPYAIQVKDVVSPKKIIPYEKGYVFDFGLNTAGICRLKVRAKSGQKISLYHFEVFENGKICTDNISFGKRTRENYWQRDEYITKDGINVYEPSFTYHGFRYVYVEGLTKKQAKKSALVMLVLTSSAKSTLKFSCSDKRIEKLFSMIINSNQSNFLYYPTDCPHREKNGWTGDAMLSAEQMLFSADYEEYLKEWLFCIRKAQRDNGQIPRIVPTCEWGFTSGESGPCWDGVLVEIPYRIYQKVGDKEVLIENLPSIEKYFHYLSSKRNEKGLISFGLGDREETFTNESSAHATPNEVTDSLTAIELLEKTVEMARIVGNESLRLYASSFQKELIAAFCKHRIDCDNKVIPYTQTGQCLLVSSRILSGENAEQAFDNLVNLLKQDRVIKMGVLGYRKIFDVLALHGKTELACQLLLTEDYSGYLYYVNKGMTSMPESFLDYKDNTFIRKDGGKPLGLNHHWYGHILGGIIRHVVGLSLDCYRQKQLILSPYFIKELNKIRVELLMGRKKTVVSWKSKGDKVRLKVKSSLPICINDTLCKHNVTREKKIINGRLYTLEKNS